MTGLKEKMDCFKRQIKIMVMLFLLLLNVHAIACTSVFWSNRVSNVNVVARTMDLSTADSPKLIVYPRGISRHGEAGQNSLSWKARYGSVVVSAFKTNAVSDGLNEHGLAVHSLYFASSKYPKRDETQPGISNLILPQYLLDNFKSVADAVENISHFQVVSTPFSNKKWPIMLTMQDANGDAAVIEFTKDKMKIYHGQAYRIVTDGPSYEVQLRSLKKFQTFGGTKPLPGDSSADSRFVRAATYLRSLPVTGSQVSGIASILSVIRTAMVPFGAISTTTNPPSWPTRWVTVADLNKKIYYFNSSTDPNIVWLDFRNLNFSELAPVLWIDPSHLGLLGEVSTYLKKQKMN